MEYLLTVILATFIPPTVIAGFPMDTGMGKCGMDEFYVNSDGLCHRNSDGSAIHVLPIPARNYCAEIEKEARKHHMKATGCLYK